MTLELTEDSFGDLQNAKFLALASELAYLSADEGVAEYQAKLGLTAKMINVGNTQAYLAGNDDHLVVAFRGTESPATFEGLKDWLLTDAVNLLIVPTGPLGKDFAAAGVGARFHQGFVNALCDIWPTLFEAIESEQKRSERALWITGHSLGGALAILSAWILQRRFVSVHQVYTFGSPMVGNVEASKAIDHAFPKKIYRVVNSPDPVPKLPTISMVANDYGHVETIISEGVGTGATSTAELFTNFLSRSADGLIQGTIVDDLWKRLTGVVGAHLMPSYHHLLDRLKR